MRCWKDLTRPSRQLTKEFPSLEDLVSQHDSSEELSISPALGEWVDQSDNIQKKNEEDLLIARSKDGSSDLPRSGSALFEAT